MDALRIFLVAYMKIQPTKNVRASWSQYGIPFLRDPDAVVAFIISSKIDLVLRMTNVIPHEFAQSTVIKVSDHYSVINLSWLLRRY